MLNDADRELIAAALDGELTPSQETAFRRLVAESAEALAIHQLLLRDRAMLRALPVPTAPPDVFATVMARVNSRAVPARPATRPVRAPRWLPIGLAASVMILVGGSSFWLFQRQVVNKTAVAQNQGSPTSYPVEIQPTPTPAPATQAKEIGPSPRPRTETVAVAPPRKIIEVTPPPRPVGELLTAPVTPEAATFHSVQVRLPALFAVSDLAGEEVRRRFAAELGRDAAVRIDLFTTETAKAAEALTAAGQRLNVTLTSDAIAQERLRKRVPCAWAVFVDVLTPSELTEWVAAATKGELAGTAHVVTAGAVEQKEWKDLLGVEPHWVKRKPEGSAKPISAGTADQVTSVIQPPGTKAERPALLVTYLPKDGRVSAALSREVKAFTDRRGERKPGAVSAMIVIRSNNS